VDSARAAIHGMGRVQALELATVPWPVCEDAPEMRYRRLTARWSAL